MPVALLAIVTLIYVSVAVIFACQGNWPMAVVYFGYGVANLGLMAIA